MATLYAWQIRPVSSNARAGYEWQWTREDRYGRTKGQSDKRFQYYYDCVVDAKRHGFNPDAPRRMR
jgi:hypothetical protein